MIRPRDDCFFFRFRKAIEPGSELSERAIRVSIARDEELRFPTFREKVQLVGDKRRRDSYQQRSPRVPAGTEADPGAKRVAADRQTIRVDPFYRGQGRDRGADVVSFCIPAGASTSARSHASKIEPQNCAAGFGQGVGQA